MKTGLVLEGGAMRGIYTAGVLDIFMEEQIHFDGVIGVSAGALHGCSFVSGQKGRSIRYYKNYRNDKHFMSIWNLIHTGEVVGRDFCYHEIPERLDPYDYEAFYKAAGGKKYDIFLCEENRRQYVPCGHGLQEFVNAPIKSKNNRAVR